MSSAQTNNSDSNESSVQIASTNTGENTASIVEFPTGLNTNFFQRMDSETNSDNGSPVGSMPSDSENSEDRMTANNSQSSNGKNKKKKSAAITGGKILKIKDRHLNNLISKEVKLKDFQLRLDNTRQENIFIKEVLLESELDYIKSIKQLKGVFKTELQTAINKVNSLYQNELSRIRQLYQSAIVGESLIEIVKAISAKGWYLLMKDNSVNAYKFYNPGFDVTKGCYNSGRMIEYSSKVCTLRGIYVNILHPKINYNTIQLACVGQHPNCMNGGFSQACPGSFLDREIIISEPKKLVNLLDEISSTYEKVHLDSSYYQPPYSYTVLPNTNWKAG